MLNPAKFSIKGSKKAQAGMTLGNKTVPNGQNSVKVTLKYEPSDNCSPLGISIFNEEIGIQHSNYEDFYGKNEQFDLRLPPGEYDMAAAYLSMYGNFYMAFKEKVSVKNDTVIFIPQKEATHPISLQLLDDKGTNLHMPVYNETGEIIVKEPTADFCSSTYFFVLPEVGTVMAAMGGNERYKGFEPDVYVTPLSNRYMLYGTRVATVGSKFYFSKYSTNDLSQEEYFNQPSDFICYEQPFAISPQWKDDETLHAPGFLLSSTYKGTALAEQILTLEKNPEGKHSVTMYLNAPLETDDKGVDKFNLLVKPAMTEFIKIGEDGFIDPYKDILCTFGPNAAGDKNGIHFIISGYDSDGGFNAAENTTWSRLLPGHPRFSSFNVNKFPLFGNNVPVNSVKVVYSRTLNGEDLRDILPNYVGRYGEYRIADTLIVERKEGINADGKQTLSFVNSNITVDELPGKNITEICYNEQKNDMAPTLQMLAFRDKTGNITDRFETKEDGVIEFSGGDFEFVITDNERVKGHYNCDLVTVKAYTSPYRKENWQDLTVNRVDELYFMPGFGHFFRGSLGNVEGKGKDGWFDIKIELSDQAGNTQTQILSPAFRIADAVDTHIENTLHKNICLKVNEGILECIGTPVTSIQISSTEGHKMATSLSSRISTGHLPHGIYLVSVRLKDGTVSTHKMIL